MFVLLGQLQGAVPDLLSLIESSFVSSVFLDQSFEAGSLAGLFFKWSIEAGSLTGLFFNRSIEAGSPAGLFFSQSVEAGSPAVFPSIAAAPATGKSFGIILICSIASFDR